MNAVHINRGLSPFLIQVLSEDNQELLRVIIETKPASLKELAAFTGRKRKEQGSCIITFLSSLLINVALQDPTFFRNVFFPLHLSIVCLIQTQRADTSQPV